MPDNTWPPSDLPPPYGADYYEYDDIRTPPQTPSRTPTPDFLTWTYELGPAYPSHVSPPAAYFSPSAYAHMHGHPPVDVQSMLPQRAHAYTHAQINTYPVPPPLVAQVPSQGGSNNNEPFFSERIRALTQTTTTSPRRRGSRRPAWNCCWFIIVVIIMGVVAGTAVKAIWS